MSAFDCLECHTYVRFINISPVCCLKSSLLARFYLTANTEWPNKECRAAAKSYDYRNRRRLPTPSPEPQNNEHPDCLTNGHISDSNISPGWFKSLDRLSRRKPRKDEIESFASGEDELPLKSSSKNLRFFGDSLREKNIYNNRSRTNISGRDKIKSQSTRDLHNISEERSTRQGSTIRSNHQSMFNISESDRETNRSVKSSLKPPISPNHRARDTTRRDERNRRNKNEVSSLESSTEGESSQQSQRSVVYLHAATVGDIPGPGFLRSSSRAPSREELTSNSNKIQPTVKTLSRSFSMLAPWKPKHYRESVDIDYSQYPKPIPVPKNGKYEQKASKNGASRNSVSSTLKKKAHETKRSNQNISTLNSHRSKSKENISSSQTLKRIKDEPIRTSSSTLYKKKDRLPRENSRYSKEKDDKRFFSKSASVESLGGHFKSNKGPRPDNREVSRSVSMPRDPEKSAGWFKMGKKYKNASSQHL
ncbi:hypothetical protein WA026_015736 [Henosepilachna vigintioctopunctata]|uniref:Uncharacterized protein n=1 Tax=Henosepilachna vigintioctopunctata TaxID=420089 RepID=A0AAW1V1Q8_9CUCU